MKPAQFVSALWDDIIGKDANGRTAEEKIAYINTLIVLLAAATAGSLFVFPLAAIPFGGVLAWKVKIRLTNTF